MKRDNNVRLLVLRKVRDHEGAEPLQIYEDLVEVRNAARLIREGFIEGEVVENGSGMPVNAIVCELTDSGHDLLEQLEAQQLAAEGQKKGAARDPELMRLLLRQAAYGKAEAGLVQWNDENIHSNCDVLLTENYTK